VYTAAAVTSQAREIRPHGSWPSPISAEWLTAGSLRLSQPRLSGGALFWLEGRPREGGRQVVMRAERGAARELTPEGASIRTRVHEYGGGDYAVGAGRLVFSRDEDRRVYVMPAAGGDVRALTDGSAWYADFAISPDGRWVVAVEERAREGAEPTNRLVAISLEGADRRHDSNQSRTHGQGGSVESHLAGMGRLPAGQHRGQRSGFFGCVAKNGQGVAGTNFEIQGHRSRQPVGPSQYHAVKTHGATYLPARGPRHFCARFFSEGRPRHPLGRKKKQGGRQPSAAR